MYVSPVLLLTHLVHGSRPTVRPSEVLGKDGAIPKSPAVTAVVPFHVSVKELPWQLAMHTREPEAMAELPAVTRLT